MATTTVAFLLPDLRLQIGDIDSTQYRYLDEWLEKALLASIKTLQRWWNFKYLVDNTDVSRNPSLVFPYTEPPVIQSVDERPIILMASIILKRGSLQNNSWSLASWKDAELSYSNLEGGRQMEGSLKEDWNELISLVSPPTKQNTFARKMHLPGFVGNIYEHD